MLINTCSLFNINNAKTTADTGVWIDDGKISAIGVHVSKHITSHGFALNCNVDLKYFDKIPGGACGILDKYTTSLTEELRKNCKLSSLSCIFLNCHYR